MRKLTDAEKKQIWEEVRREFPDDEMMQQIHYVRLLHYRQTEGFSSQERIQSQSQRRHQPRLSAPPLRLVGQAPARHPYGL